MSLAEYEWGSGFDAWEQLPGAVRDEMLAAGTTGWPQVFAGVATYNKVWRPLRPVIVRQDGFDALNAVTDRMLGLLLETCRRRASTAGELRELLGTPLGRIRFLDLAEPLDERMLIAGRPDFVVSGGVPRLVEFNIGSDLGSAMDSDDVAARFLQLYEQAGIAARVPVTAPYPAVDGRFAAMRDPFGLPAGTKIVMAFRGDGEYPGLDDLSGLRGLLAPVVERAAKHGLELLIEPLHTLELDADDRLLAGGVPVEGVFRMFVPAPVPDSSGLEALEKAVRLGTVRMFTSTGSWLVSNKRVLAWLWSDLDVLDPDDRALVERYLPRTEELTGELRDRVLRDRETLVLKPQDEWGGNNVVVGVETTDEAWRTAVDKAVTGGYIVQEYVDPDRIAMQFTGLETGQRSDFEVLYSISPYSFGRRGAGCYLRLGGGGDGRVLNLHRGVHVTGPLILESSYAEGRG